MLDTRHPPLTGPGPEGERTFVKLHTVRGGHPRRPLLERPGSTQDNRRVQTASVAGQSRLTHAATIGAGRSIHATPSSRHRQRQIGQSSDTAPTSVLEPYHVAAAVPLVDPDLMRLYADRPGIATRQFVSDLLVVAWVGSWIWVALKVYAFVERLAVPGRKIEDAGTGIAGGLSDAGDTVGRVPGVGGTLASPLDRAAAGAQQLADAGRAQQHSVDQLAIVIVVLLLIVPLGLVLFGWLPRRLRWMRRAKIGSVLRADHAGRDLLALRALAREPLRRLMAIHPDPASAWRTGDPSTVDALARLELRALGLDS
jgi:hypothetical protein